MDRKPRDVWYDLYNGQLGSSLSVEETLRFYMRLFDESPAPYIVTDASLKILNANTAAQRLLDRTLPYLRDKPLSLIIAGSDIDAFRRILKETVVQSRRSIDRPLRIRPAHQGTEREMLFSASVLRNASGTPEFICWVFHEMDRTSGTGTDIL